MKHCRSCWSRIRAAQSSRRSANPAERMQSTTMRDEASSSRPSCSPAGGPSTSEGKRHSPRPALLQRPQELVSPGLQQMFSFNLGNAHKKTDLPVPDVVEERGANATRAASARRERAG